MILSRWWTVWEVWSGCVASPEGANALDGRGLRRVMNMAGVVNVEGQDGRAFKEGGGVCSHSVGPVHGLTDFQVASERLGKKCRAQAYGGC
jgi:hypothetical protein